MSADCAKEKIWRRISGAKFCAGLQKVAAEDRLGGSGGRVCRMQESPSHVWPKSVDMAVREQGAVGAEPRDLGVVYNTRSAAILLCNTCYCENSAKWEKVTHPNPHLDPLIMNFDQKSSRAYQ